LLAIADIELRLEDTVEAELIRVRSLLASNVRPIAVPEILTYAVTLLPRAVVMVTVFLLESKEYVPCIVLLPIVYLRVLSLPNTNLQEPGLMPIF
jgi:hypothetical protein